MNNHSVQRESGGRIWPPLPTLRAMSPNRPDMHQIPKSIMFVKAKVAGTLLLVLIVWGISSASLLSLPSPQGRATGCPMHRQSLPQRLPISHNCCQTGHDAAMLQKAANPQHDVLVAVVLRSDRKPVPQDVFALFRDQATSPGTPPAKLQLRI